MQTRASQLRGVRHDNTRQWGRRPVAVVALFLGVFLAVVGVAGAPSVGAQDDTTTSTLPGVGDTIPAPDVVVADDGLSATDGTRTLTVSAAKDLAVAGATLTVTGTGYDVNKGIYVAFCKAMPHGETPTPCGGGATTEGSTGASQWISTNPPPYGRGLAIPYGPDGSFSVQLTVAPEISDEVDCLKIQCVVVTRNDHTRTSDHSQDVTVPVGFEGTAFPTTTTTEALELSIGESSDSGGNGWVVPVAIGGGIAVVLAGGVLIGRRRKS